MGPFAAFPDFLFSRFKISLRLRVSAREQSERQAGDAEAGGQLAHLVGREFLGIGTRLAHGAQHEILEEFDIARADHLGSDLDGKDITGAAGLHGDLAPSGGGLDLTLGEVFLDLGHLLLRVGRGAHHLGNVHGIGWVGKRVRRAWVNQGGSPP